MARHAPVIQNLSGDPLVDVELVNVRRVLEEAYRGAAEDDLEEPTGFVFDVAIPLARRVAEEARDLSALQVALESNSIVVGCLPRRALGRELFQAVSAEASIALRDVPLDDPGLWNVVVMTERRQTVATVDWRALLGADVATVVAHADRVAAAERGLAQQGLVTPLSGDAKAPN